MFLRLDMYLHDMHVNSGRSLFKVFKRLKENFPNYELYSIRTLKYDGTMQSIPVTSLYTENNYRETSGDDAERIPRFDWVTVRGEDEDELTSHPVQLMTLLELLFPSRDGLIRHTMYLYIAADTVSVEKPRPVTR